MSETVPELRALGVRVTRWTRVRAGVLEVVLVLAGVWAVLHTASPLLGRAAREVLLAPVAGGLPLWVVIAATVPLTVLTAANPLALSRFGGAVLVAFDSAALAFTLWVGLGAVLADWCAAEACGPRSGERALVAVGAWTLLAWLVGVVVSELRNPENKPRVRVFNVALSAVAGSATVLVTAEFTGRTSAQHQAALAEGRLGPTDLAAVAVGALTYTVVDFVLSAVSVAWVEGVRVREVLRDVNALGAAGTGVAVACVGVFAAMTTLHNAWSLLLLVPVVVALVYTARIGTRATTEQELSEALYGAAVACQRAQHPPEVMAAVSHAVHRALQAPVRVGEEPEEDQIGTEVVRSTSTQWLAAGPRPSGRLFTERDSEFLHSLGSLAGQALQRVEGVAEIRRTAETDALTSLATRAVLMSSAEAVLDRAREAAPGTPERSTSLVFCDVDHFKEVNDTLGHRAGDAVLVGVAQRMRSVVRERDVVARLGGDEFAMLLVSTDEHAVVEVVERLRRALDAPYDLGEETRRVGVSIGHATWRPGRRTTRDPSVSVLDWLLEEADQQMYAVKQERAATTS